MSSTQMSDECTTRMPTTRTMDMKFEVVVIPVSDVERTKQFYVRLGWRVDADFAGEGFRIVQLTPPGSPSSIHFGRGITAAVPGSLRGLILIVDDVRTARAGLIEKGVDVSEPFHYADIRGPRVPGPDPEGRSYCSWASFNDPDGNEWLLQEIKTRLPGRGLSLDVATLTALLREAEAHHGEYESTAPKHHWSDWYAAYIVARERGRPSEAAEKEAVLHIENPHQ
ncbi:MAG: VOC family protein [Betaproteobacteria bacterium]